MFPLDYNIYFIEKYIYINIKSRRIIIIHYLAVFFFLLKVGVVNSTDFLYSLVLGKKKKMCVNGTLQ